MARSPVPAATRRRPPVARAARRVAAVVVAAVFGYGLITSLALVALGAVLYFAFGLSTAGTAVGVVGAVIGLVCAVAQGAFV